MRTINGERFCQPLSSPDEAFESAVLQAMAVTPHFGHTYHSTEGTCAAKVGQTDEGWCWNALVQDLTLSCMHSVDCSVQAGAQDIDSKWEPEMEDQLLERIGGDMIAIKPVLEDLRSAVAEVLTSAVSLESLERLRDIQHRLVVGFALGLQREQPSAVVNETKLLQETLDKIGRVDCRTEGWCWNYLTENLTLSIMSSAGCVAHEQVRDARISLALEELQCAAETASCVEVSNENIQVVEQMKGRLDESLACARELHLDACATREAEVQRRRLHYGLQDLKGQIRVCCRIRGLSDDERSVADSVAVKVVDGETVECNDGSQFVFDRVFAPGTQDEVFDECRDMIESALEGRNVTMFAYGQTGAGKTYTMYGTREEAGLALRTISEVFRLIDTLPRHRSVTVTASVAELYNNDLFDLLVPAPRDGKGRAKVSMREDTAGAIRPDLIEVEAIGPEEMTNVLCRGLSRRATGDNGVNAMSSRSHLLFTIGIASTSKHTGETLRGKILLCDLGGAERLKKSTVAGARQKESIELNKSLSALGNVIEAIAKKQKVVPYRDHKLTRIMQDSLGGTARTLMIVNTSCASSNFNETIMALKYAARVSRIERKTMPISDPR